jgi:hypothetical protein
VARSRPGVVRVAGGVGISGAIPDFESDFRRLSQFRPGGGLDRLSEVAFDPIRDESTVGLDPKRAILDHEIGGAIEPHVPPTGTDSSGDFPADAIRNAFQTGRGTGFDRGHACSVAREWLSQVSCG